MSPKKPSPNKIRKNRRYVRKLKNLEDQKLLQKSSTSSQSYEDDLNEYSMMRLSMNQPSTSTATSFVNASPDKSQNSVVEIHDDDSEIEEGEIVEREVSQCVDLIHESFSALRRSRRLTDLSPLKINPKLKQQLFFEDKRGDYSQVQSPPIYNVDTGDLTFNSTATDDSVIFISEEKPLEKPKFLLSPAINQLAKLSGVNLTPPISEKKDVKVLSPTQLKRRERIAKWQQKKMVQYAQKEVAKAMESQPSTSAAANDYFRGEKKKRIILIDGSNVAITHAKSKLGKDFDEKSPKAFSVEGLQRALKYFEDQGFQVKAVLPEYRLSRDKSSNWKMLHDLKENGSLISTASRAYDDRILLQSAAKLNAAVVSNDFFRDFRADSNYHDVLNSRQLRYNWVFDEFILTEDSYGRNGPRLQDILYISN